MPSALRSNATSSLGYSPMKPPQPRISSTVQTAASFTPADLMRRVLTAALRLTIAARVPRAKIVASNKTRIGVQSDEIIAAISAAS